MPSNLPSPKKVSPTEHASMTAIGSAMPAQLVAFAHATMFSPALSTLGLALNKGYLTNFPGLTAKTLRKYPPQSFPMVKGHLDQTRKNQAKTKQKPESANTNDDGDDDVFPTIPPAVSEVITAMLLSWNQQAKFTLIKQDALYRHLAMETTIYSFYMTMTATASWQSPSRHKQDKQF
jgi:hypothetical protein